MKNNIIVNGIRTNNENNTDTYGECKNRYWENLTNA